MFKTLLSLLTLALLALALLAAAPAGATSVQEALEELCIANGRYAALIARHRDDGMLPSESLAVIRQHERKDPKQATYLAWMREIVLTVHKQWWMTPTMAQQHFELECFETAVARFPRHETPVTAKKGRQ